MAEFPCLCNRLTRAKHLPELLSGVWKRAVRVDGAESGKYIREERFSYRSNTESNPSIFMTYAARAKVWELHLLGKQWRGENFLRTWLLIALGSLSLRRRIITKHASPIALPATSSTPPSDHHVVKPLFNITFLKKYNVNRFPSHVRVKHKVRFEDEGSSLTSHVTAR